MAAKKKTDETPQEEVVQEETPETTDTAEAVPTPEEELKNANDKYLRLMAEYDNFRKRSAKERENIYSDVRIDTLTRILPVYDNLERALKAETADEAFKKGVEMTFNQLVEIFGKLGVEAIESVGRTFDPNVHNAVMHVEDDAYGENEIIEEFQKGFRVGDRILRFSMVKVAN